MADTEAPPVEEVHDGLMPWPRRTSYGLAALTSALLVASLGFAALEPNRATLMQFGVALLVGPATAAISVVISRRERGLLVGALLGLVGATTVHVCAKENFRQWLATDHERARSFAWLEGVWSQSALIVLMAVALLLLYFPDGRLPSRRWRWVPPMLVACTLLDQLRAAFMEPIREPLEFLAKPFPSLPAWLDLALEAALFVMVALVLASAGSILVRYRGADHIQKRQIKWLALGGFGVVVYPLMCLVEILLLGDTWWFSVAIAVAGLVGIPPSIGVAMLRHDLYDVDKALAGAVTWSLLTAALRRVYGVGSCRRRRPGGPRLRTGGGRRHRPVRRRARSRCAVRLQRVVDARLYPSVGPALRRDREAAPRGRRGRGAPGAARGRPADRAARPGPAGRLPAARPRRLVDARRRARRPGELAVAGRRSAGGQIGVLCAGSAARPRAAAEIAAPRGDPGRGGAAAPGAGRALREVEASRARLVQVGYEERRRLERDLHDGAQQRLVSLGMALRLAQRHLGDGTVDVDGLLDQAVAELGTAVAELRQIAHGLRPSCLGRRAARGARRRWSAACRSPSTCDVEPAALPDDVATTAYYVVSEAITNAVKHAEATGIRLRVVPRRRHGVAGAASATTGAAAPSLSAPGSGLADRVAALGGSLLGGQPAGRAARPSRRCCRAHRDRGGLGALPRGPGPAARPTPATRSSARPATPTPWWTPCRRASPTSPSSTSGCRPDRTDDGARAARALRRRRTRGSASCCSPSTSRPGTRSSWWARGGFGYLLKDRVLDVDDFLDALRTGRRGRLRARPRGGRRLLAPGRRTTGSTP